MKTYVCIDCGQEFEWEGYKRKKRCLNCAGKRVAESILQIQKKEGPHYEKWKLHTEAARRALRKVK